MEGEEHAQGAGPHEILHDIHSISNELESLYHHYSRRIKNVSEELSRERSKQRIYQLEIAENHQTIQTLTEQIEFLLSEMEVKQELYLQLQKEQRDKSLLEEVHKRDAAFTKVEQGKLHDPPDDSPDGMMDSVLPTSIPEIRVIYESTHNEYKSYVEKVKNDVITALIDANRAFVTSLGQDMKIDADYGSFFSLLEWIGELRKHYEKKPERWYTDMWNFLWGKETENNHPEIIKKLDLIEDQLVSYSNKINEVKATLEKDSEKDEKTQEYLQKMNALHEELKKIEGYYEEELDALKNQLEDMKQRETALEKQVNLLNEVNDNRQKEKNVRELEMEKELNALRENLQTQSNKKSDLYKKMKQRSTDKAPQVNQQFEEYGNIPMDSESKRTMFNPNKYIR
ncbi:hypothetical protein [Bacillus sp. KH172YL63]|uniref:hypothetical protein n=1 Tax=Bacillus sp. KH172YL63 TaxID=2709784 RepID=UPI0013E48FDE|nr:hypothetical protein [Bacillus sp. KH172YL63]BCB03437.1 hypothetical protein KH172YL63_15700 [Bacillus sp. KH172YL63]